MASREIEALRTRGTKSVSVFTNPNVIEKTFGVKSAFNADLFVPPPQQWDGVDLFGGVGVVIGFWVWK